MPGMGPITAIIPRKVAVKLGDVDYFVGEFRLSDLAELQGFLDDRFSDPIAHLRERIETTEELPLELERELALIYKRIDAPTQYVYGEHRTNDREFNFLSSVNFLRVALKRYAPEVNMELAEAILAYVKPGQISNLARIVWGSAPVEEIGKLFGWRLRKHRTSIRWTKAIVELVSAYPAYRLEDVYGLTLTEFWALRSGGKERQVGEWEIRGGIAQAAEERRKWWNRLMGKPDA
jgi:hypothetical protein